MLVTARTAWLIPPEVGCHGPSRPRKKADLRLNHDHHEHRCPFTPETCSWASREKSAWETQDNTFNSHTICNSPPRTGKMPWPGSKSSTIYEILTMPNLLSRMKPCLGWSLERPKLNPNPISIDDLMITEKAICTPTLRPAENFSQFLVYKQMNVHHLPCSVKMYLSGRKQLETNDLSERNTHPDHLSDSSMQQFPETSFCSHSSGHKGPR